MKLMKTVATMMLAVFLLTQNVYASGTGREPDFSAEAYGIMRWTNVQDISLNLSFKNGKAECSGSVSGNPGTTLIYATIYLDQKTATGGYTGVTSWTTSVSGSYLPFSYSYAVASGYTYRLSIHVSVTMNGVSETANAKTESTY